MSKSDAPDPPRTVGDLLRLLAAFHSDRPVVFLDPDTAWLADVVVREPTERESRETEFASNPVVVAGNPYD